MPICQITTNDQGIIGSQLERCPSPEIDVTDQEAVINKSSIPTKPTTTTNSSSTPPRARSIRFDPVVYIQEMEPRPKSQDRIDELWYSQTEYLYMKAFSFILAEQIESKMEGTTADHEALRGLESFSPVGMRKRQENKVDGWKAVLKEQQHQRAYFDGEVIDEYSIAKVYMDKNKKCVQEASERAWIDAMAVRKMRILDEIGDDNDEDGLKSARLSSSKRTTRKQLHLRLVKLLSWRRRRSTRRQKLKLHAQTR